MVMTVRIHEYGGPEVLRYEDVPIGSPGPGEVLVRHRAIGLNCADIHTREGRYPVDSLPHAIGGEGCGVIEEIGDNVDHVKLGDRVAYSTGGHALPRGTYTESRVLSADRMIVLPDAIGDETAAAMVSKGLTARVIGVAGTEEKAPLAADHGCHHTIISGAEDIAARVRELTEGEGVPVVYDAVGRDTFDASLHSLRPRGMLVSYGTASGPVPPPRHFRAEPAGVALCNQRRLLLAHADP